MSESGATRGEPPRLEWAWAVGDLVSTALMLVGAFLAVAVGVAGAVVMLCGLGVSLATHAVVGVIGYRRVMAREWPKVRPIRDDDDW